MSRETVPKQLLHLVSGNGLADLNEPTFKDLDKLDIAGILSQRHNRAGRRPYALLRRPPAPAARAVCRPHTGTLTGWT